MEAYDLLHPLLPRCRAVGMDVHPLGHLRVGLPGNDPPAVVKLVPVVIARDNVEQQDVFRLLVQAGDLELEVGEHLPGREKGNVGVNNGLVTVYEKPPPS